MYLVQHHIVENKLGQHPPLLDERLVEAGLYAYHFL